MIAAIILAPMATAAQKERVVNFYNWSDYIDPTVLEDFSKESGIKVRYDTFDSNDTLEAKLLAGKSGYDVVVPTAYFLARQIIAGVFQKLDKTKLPNLVNAWPEIARRLAVYDPGNQYAVNYMWGTTGIGYNVNAARKIFGSDAAAAAAMGSWDAVFDPEKIARFKDCGIYLLELLRRHRLRGAALSAARSELERSRRSGKSRGVAYQDQAVCAQVPLLGIS